VLKNHALRIQHPNLVNHTGSLLVALPTLLDPNFRRTILLLTHHDPKEGSLGFVLNRPREKFLGELTDAPRGLSDVAVFDGGPVERQNLILTRLHWREEGVRFQSLSEEDFTFKEEETLFSQDDPTANNGQSLRAFTGYAGWSAGQLEQEIAEKSWHLMKPTAEMLLPINTPEEGMKRWKSIMKTLGPWYHLLAQTPDNLSLN
jgi:putative transcriptional regulator